MSADLSTKLVAMANQIATSFAGQSSAPVHETAAHINGFWTPRMRERISRHLECGGAGLTPIAAQAVAELARP